MEATRPEGGRKGGGGRKRPGGGHEEGVSCRGGRVTVGEGRTKKIKSGVGVGFISWF